MCTLQALGSLQFFLEHSLVSDKVLIDINVYMDTHTIRCSQRAWHYLFKKYCISEHFDFSSYLHAPLQSKFYVVIKD